MTDVPWQASLQCPGCPRRQSSAQSSRRGLDPKRRGDVRELAVLLTPFEEGIDPHIPAQPMVERKNGWVATVSTLALNVASRSSLNGLFHQ